VRRGLSIGLRIMQRNRDMWGQVGQAAHGAWHKILVSERRL
jgi:hypothetical protein